MLNHSDRSSSLRFHVLLDSHIHREICHPSQPPATPTQTLTLSPSSVSISLYPSETPQCSDFIVLLPGLSISAPGGEARGLDTEAFYEFLKSRGSGIITVPADRWNAEAYHGTAPGKICTVRSMPGLDTSSTSMTLTLHLPFTTD